MLQLSVSVLMFGCGLHQRLHSNIKIALAICSFTALSLVCNISVDCPRKSNELERQKKASQTKTKKWKKGRQKELKEIGRLLPSSSAHLQTPEVRLPSCALSPVVGTLSLTRLQLAGSKVHKRQIKETYKTISCQRSSMSTEFINKKDLNKSPVISLLVQWFHKQENHLPNVISGCYYYYYS